MSSLFGIGANGASDASFYDESIDNSARFDDGSSAYLSRTPSSAGDRRTYTLSFWVKRANLSIGDCAIFGVQTDGNNRVYVRWETDDTFKVYFAIGGTAYDSGTTMKFRDTSAWYHIVIAVDMDASGNTNKLKIYVNGTNQPVSYGATLPTADTAMNSTSLHTLGKKDGASNFLDGYLSEVNFIDGTALDPTSFGETKNGVWIPKEISGLTYGTNGFRLQFNQTGTGTASTSTIGADTSGNTNHYTSSGLASTDVVLDSPTNNFPVLNPLVVSNNTNANVFAEGNLEGTTGNNAGGNITGSMAIPSSGKWYFEFRPMAVGNGVFIGLWNPVATQQFSYSTTPVILYVSHNGGLRLNGTSPSYGATYSAADTVGVAVDVDNGTVTFYKNNASQGSTNFAAGGLFPVITDWYTSTNIRVRVNFGQDSTFSDARLGGGATSDTGHDYSAYISATTARVNNGWNNAGGAPASGMPAVGDTVQFNNTSNQIVGSSSGGTDFIVTAITQQGSSGGAANNAIVTLNRSVLSHSPAMDGGSSILLVAAGSVFTNNATDDNGRGNFVYAPPSEHLALCSENLPEPTIGPNSLTQSDDYFTPYIWTGNGSNPRAFTDVGFQADWIWIKKRSGAGTSHHITADSSRGDNKTMLINADNSEATNDGNGYISDTTTAGGFTVNAGSTSDEMVNDGSDTYVAWLWKANGGTTSSNTDGSITSTVQANTDAGFSIVLYNGEGDGQATVGHGLGVKPQVIIAKNRGAAGNWHTYHEGTDSSAPEDYGVLLNSTNARANDAGFHNDTAPTSSVFTVGTYNNFDYDYVAYCFAEIEGYSKFGSYTGNGNADGAFVYLGFRPAFIMLKCKDDVCSWNILDNKRDPDNTVNQYILPNSADAEGSLVQADFLSNGIKFRTTNAERNGTRVILYMAFAEVPFKYANAR
jgi:hypothetical protein